MAKVKQSEKLDLFFVIVTDVLKVNSKILILGEAEQKVAEQAFGSQTKAEVLDIGSKMSRKKEIAPPIEEALK